MQVSECVLAYYSSLVYRPYNFYFVSIIVMFVSCVFCRPCATRIRGASASVYSKQFNSAAQNPDMASSVPPQRINFYRADTDPAREARLFRLYAVQVIMKPDSSPDHESSFSSGFSQNSQDSSVLAMLDIIVVQCRSSSMWTRHCNIHDCGYDHEGGVSKCSDVI